MSHININVQKEQPKTIKDIPKGSYFLLKEELYLKIHHVRSSMGDVPSLTVVLPNFDHNDELKVRSACVKMKDGTGYYFPEVTFVTPVCSVNITVEV